MRSHGTVVAFQDVSSHLSSRGVAEVAGSMLLLLVRVCATGTVLIREKALTGALAGGSGGGTLGASFFPWGTTTGHPVLKHGVSE